MVVFILLCFFKPRRFTGWGFLVTLLVTFVSMEDVPNQIPPEPDLTMAQQQRVQAASDFLSICDRLSNDYDSGYYWEDVQRALRIAAGLETWPE